MPLCKPEHYEERVFTSVIGDEVNGSKGLRDAARHVVSYDDPSALSWMVERFRDNVGFTDDMTDDELEGAIEWYLRRGSSIDYG